VARADRAIPSIAYAEARRLRYPWHLHKTGKGGMSEDPAVAPAKPYIVVFKPKDRRSFESLDKTDIVRSVMSGRRGRDLRVFKGSTQRIGSSLADVDPELAAFDVNDYHTPIVCVRLTSQELAQLAQHPDVEIIEPDNDFNYANGVPSRRLHIEGQPSLQTETVPAGVAAINAPAAWGNSQGKGIRIAVLDTGIDNSHPDLAENVIGGIGLVPGTPGERDDEGHGTFCAGVIGASINGAGVVGVAPQASLYAVKVSDETGTPSLRSVIAGLDWCIANRIHIVNMCFGFEHARMSLYLMCRRAWDSGVLLVASVGNGGAAEVTYPAAFDCVIGVGAIDAANAHYPRSNRGVGVNVCAPGVDILSTGLRGAYQTMSGTSAACPHVAGAAALAWGAHRFADNNDIWHLLAATARPLGSRKRFGCGRVNALAASGALTRPTAPLPRLWGWSLRVALDAHGQRAAMATEESDETNSKLNLDR
jgi:subtilisin